MYIGDHSLYYLLTDSRIAVHSTISTPSFDRRLLEYWDCFPEHYPTVVVIERGDTDASRADEIDFIMDTLDLREPVAENDEFAVYRVNSRSST